MKRGLGADLLRSLSPVRWFEQATGLTPDPKQVEVLESRSPRILLNCCRQWGKSTTTAARAVHGALYAPGRFALAVSPTVRQTAELFRKMAGMLERCGVEVRGDGDNPISLLLPNGSRIVGAPAREANIRGFSAVDLVIIDEAARVPKDVYQVVRPMLAVRNGSIILLSTPFGERGFFYDEWSRKDDAWTKISVKATDCPRISREFLKEEWKTLGEFWFKQEYLCEFMPDGGRLFTDEMLERATVKGEWTMPDDGEWMRPKGVNSWLWESEIEVNRKVGDRVYTERIKP